MNQYSDLLFARPSFLKGIARIFDVRGELDQYNTSPSDELADCRALRSDWRAVGDDLQEAMNSFKTDLPADRSNG
jgi:hypothetical protein